MTPTTYCSGLRCGRKNICALWSHHLTPPLPRPLNIAQYADHAGSCTKFELRRTVVPAARFPEDDLPLLAPDISAQTAASFAKHISSLLPAIRTKQLKQPKPKLTGKKVKNATKKSDGIYLIELSVVATRFEFSHNNAKEISADVFQNALRTLQCPDALLREFFTKKNFVIL